MNLASGFAKLKGTLEASERPKVSGWLLEEEAADSPGSGPWSEERPKESPRPCDLRDERLGPSLQMWWVWPVRPHRVHSSSCVQLRSPWLVLPQFRQEPPSSRRSLPLSGASRHTWRVWPVRPQRSQCSSSGHSRRMWEGLPQFRHPSPRESGAG
jgi:hypothetical protein